MPVAEGSPLGHFEYTDMQNVCVQSVTMNEEEAETIMNMGAAKAIARQWLAETWEGKPGFLGAIYCGSTNWKADETEYVPPSDIDILIWIDSETRTLDRLYRDGVILQPALLPYSRLSRTPEEILSDFRIASHFSVPSIIADPTGHLTLLHQAIAPVYAQRQWVCARCERVGTRLDEILDTWLAPDLETDAFWMQVMDFYYAVFILSEIIPVADLRDPTVRKAFVLSGEILAKQGRLDLQEALFALLGCQHMGRADVEAHFAVYENAFDQASAFVHTPFFFSAEVSATARPVSVGGVRDLIDSGCHREAMFWLVFIYSIAVQVMQTDGPIAEQAAHLAQYRQQMADLGLRTKADISARVAQLKALVPTFRAVAEQMMNNHPAIQN